jgi:hypothetical protein
VRQLATGKINKLSNRNRRSGCESVWSSSVLVFFPFLATGPSNTSHYGNAASTMKLEVALWTGVGFGTVLLVTKHVIKAFNSEHLCFSSVRWPSDVEKAAPKAWVEEASCPAWHDRWLMVDGTLIPLFMHPGFYGNTWFDRKSNYSINVQVSKTCSFNKFSSDIGIVNFYA